MSCGQAAHHAPALQRCRIQATHSACAAVVQYYNTMAAFREPAAEAGRRLRRLAAAAVPTDAMAAGSAEAALEGGKHWILLVMITIVDDGDGAEDLMT